MFQQRPQNDIYQAYEVSFVNSTLNTVTSGSHQLTGTLTPVLGSITGTSGAAFNIGDTLEVTVAGGTFNAPGVVFQAQPTGPGTCIITYFNFGTASFTPGGGSFPFIIVAKRLFPTLV